MSNQILAQFQTLFPPMFKRGEGLDYTFAVFSRRVMSFFWASICLAAAFGICWFVVPADVSNLKGMYQLFVRTVFASIGLYVAFRLALFWRSIERENYQSQLLRALRGPEEKEEMEMQDAKALAGIMAVTTLWESARTQDRIKFEENPERRMAFDLIRTGIKERRPESPIDKLVEQSFVMAYGFSSVAQNARLKLVLLRHQETNSNKSERIMSALKAIAEANYSLLVRIPEFDRTVVFSIELLTQRIAESRIPFTDSEKLDPAIEIANWLSSIHVGIIEANSSPNDSLHST